MKALNYLTGLVIVLISLSPAFAESHPPAVGGAFPAILLPVPESATHQKYLGVTKQEMFQVPEIDARLVIIEIFSMY